MPSVPQQENAGATDTRLCCSRVRAGGGAAWAPVVVALLALAGLAVPAEASSTSAPAAARQAPPAAASRPAPATASAESDRPHVTLVDGESFAARLTGIDAGQATFDESGKTRRVALADLWQVRWGESMDLMSIPGRKVLVLAPEVDDGPEFALAVAAFSIDGTRLLAQTALLGEVSLPLSAVRRIYLPAPSQTPSDCRQRWQQVRLPGDPNRPYGRLGSPAGRQDVLVAEGEKGALVPAPGLLKGVAGGKITFEYQGQDRTMDLAAARVIELAQAGAPGRGAGQLVGRDGSIIPFESVALAGGRMTAVLPGGQELSVQPPALAELRLGGGKAVFLSSLEPARATQTGMFDSSPFVWRRDRSSSGTPIRLAGATYTRGLGLHSRCELVYRLDGAYTALAGLAGIDDAARHGAASLVLLGDGRELIQPVTLASGQKPLPLRVDVSGVNELTIRVDFGPDNLDVGDHVSLAEIRLVKR